MFINGYSSKVVIPITVLELLANNIDIQQFFFFFFCHVIYNILYVTPLRIKYYYQNIFVDIYIQINVGSWFKPDAYLIPVC